MSTSGLVIAVTVLDVLGVSLNIWFLYTIKVRPIPYNAIDVLQAIKTILVILALMSSIWLDLVTCSDSKLSSNNITSFCIGSKVVLDNLLFDSVCYTFLSVACIRRKVCLCRGRASVLVTTRYAIKTMMLNFIPCCMFAAATVSLVSNYNNYELRFTSGSNNTSGVTSYDKTHNTIEDLINGHYSKIAYQLCHTIFLNILPIVTGLVIYINIVNIVQKTARNTDGYISQRNKRPTRAITLSVTILLVSTCSLWLIFVVTKVISIFVDVQHSVLIFLKLTILVVHPFGEGIFQPSARKRGEILHGTIEGRSSRQIYPEILPSMASLQDAEDRHSNTEYLPGLMEENSSHVSFGDKSLVQFNPGGSNVQTPVQKKRRESLLHHRPSVMIKNAAYIGLEYRDEHTIVTLAKRRRESEERCRKDLKNIDNKEAQPSCRRLSTCLRLSSLDDYCAEDFTEDCRRKYTAEQRVFDKERKISNSSSNREYKGLSYAKTIFRKDSTTVPACRSPSQKRWQKLFTTAKTARHFSQTRQHTIQNTIEEEDISSKKLLQDKRNNFKSNYGESSKPNRQTLEEQFSDASGNINISSNTNAENVNRGRVVNNFERKKKISMSSTTNERGQTKKRERNKSISYISNTAMDTSPQGNSRSISCDGKVSIKTESNENNNGIDTQVSGDRSAIGNASSPWAPTPSTTRAECIQQLLQWNDYF